MHLSKIIIASLLLLPTTAQAEYIGFNVGGIFSAESNSNGEVVSSPSNVFEADIDYSESYAADLVLGYHSSPSLGLELELGYKNAEIDSVTDSTLRNEDSQFYSAMANAIYRIKMFYPVMPYVGAGIGATMESEENETALSYQGLAGLELAINRRTSLMMGYKYFSTTEFTSEYLDNTLGQVSKEFDLTAQMVTVGLRRRF